MLVCASIAGDFATAVAVLAGTIAVGGFAGHAPLVLGSASERKIREATVVGGLVGCALSAVVVVLSAIASMIGP